MRNPDKLRPKYAKASLLLYSPTKTLLRLLGDSRGYGAHEITKIQKMNEPTELNFKITFKYLNQEKNTQLPNGNWVSCGINQDSCQNLVRIIGEDDFYIIKNVSTIDDFNFQVNCVHESVSLQKLFCEPLKSIGKTPQDLFADIKSACKTVDLNYFFEGTDVPADKLRSICGEDEQTVWDNLLSLAKLYDGWWEIKTVFEENFNKITNERKLLFLRTKPLNAGIYYIKNGLNIDNLNLNFDTSDIVTRVYGYGATSELTQREITIMDVNPTGLPYVENFGYFKEFLGMNDEEIAKDPNCHQEATYRNSDISDVQDLYNSTIDELNKKCIPQITGSLEYHDLYVFENALGGEGTVENWDAWDLHLGEQIKVINKDMNYNFDTQITGITKTYDTDPMKTPLEISNIVPNGQDSYSSIMNSLQKVNRTINTGTGGEPYVADTTVKDNTGETAKTKFKNAFARIETNEKSISIIVGDVADHESRIDVLEGEIVLRVTEEEMWSLIQLNPGKILMAVNDEKNETDVTIEPEKGLGVKNGKITIYNKNGDIMMQANTSGSMSVREGFKIENFDDATYVEIKKDGIVFYRDGYSLRGININEDSDLEFMGECKFQNNLDAYTMSIQGDDIKDIIDERITQFCKDQGWALK